MKLIKTFMMATMVAFSFSPVQAQTVEEGDPVDRIGAWKFVYPVVQFISRDVAGTISTASDVVITAEINTLCSKTEIVKNDFTGQQWRIVNTWYAGRVTTINGAPVINSLIVMDVMRYGGFGLEMQFMRTETVGDRERWVDYRLAHEFWESDMGFTGKLLDRAERFNLRRGVDAVIGGVAARRVSRNISTTKSEKEDLCTKTKDTLIYYALYGKG